MSVVLVAATALTACATRATRTAKRGKLPPPSQEDFTLGDARADDEPSGSFLSTADEPTVALSDGIPGIAGSEDPSAPEEIFGGEPPEEPSSIAQVIDELVPIHVFVTTSEATVRSQAAGEAAIVSTLPKGRRLVGLPQGDWVCIGKGQFVEAAALMPFVEESATAER